MILQKGDKRMFKLEHLIEERMEVLRGYHIADLQNAYKQFACGSKSFNKEELIRQLAHYEVWINEKNPDNPINIVDGLRKINKRKRKMTSK